MMRSFLNLIYVRSKLLPSKKIASTYSEKKTQKSQTSINTY